MLFPQLAGMPLGPRLKAEFEHAERVDIATAWVRASGIRHLKEPLEALLGRGGAATIVVGLDADNTSIEGLSELLALHPAAALQLVVRHNEAAPIFHPKLYAFRTAGECRIIVGSNNLTESGLWLNEEASGLLAEPRGGKLETSLDQYMATLTDGASTLSRPLTADLLKKLIEYGYVKPEASLPGKAANRLRRQRKATERLFGFQTPKRRPPRTQAPSQAMPIEPRSDTPVGEWRRIFLRLRLSRGTQAQIPAAVVRAIRAKLGYAELDGPLEVTVAGGDGGKQKISPTYTGGNPTPNTYKFEAFQPTGNPLLRIDVVGQNVTVEKLDSNDPTGEIVEDFILEGRDRDPPITFSRRSGEHATLWRFD